MSGHLLQCVDIILKYVGSYFIYGTIGLDLRFPGQKIQAESELLHNWYRQYDPTIGRYTQPEQQWLEAGPTAVLGSATRRRVPRQPDSSS